LWSAESLIAFRSDRDGNGEIDVMNPDGSEQTRLTNNTAYDGYPHWSSDGSQLAFDSQRSLVQTAGISGPVNDIVTTTTNHQQGAA
jgi:Tol biopolymer transport system component